MTTSRSNSRTLFVLLIAVLPVFIGLYAVIPYTYSHLEIGSQLQPVFHALWIMWNFFPDYQFGMLVPFLTAFVIYRQRRELAALPIDGWWPGIVVVAATLALYWAGRRVDNQYIGFFSIQLLLISLVLWLLGWRWLRALTFPLAFLVFTWPMPFLDNVITFPLRMFMSHVAVGSLNAFGIAAEQDGTGIFSAANPAVNLAAGQLFQVDVADPCSGIRSLFALLMISALYGHMSLKSPWKQAILFLCAVPLAIAGNLFRIMTLTMGIIVLGAPTAIGSLEHPTWFHEGAGYVVFLVALGGMLIIANLLNGDLLTWRRNFRKATSAAKPAFSKSAPTEVQSDLY